MKKTKYILIYDVAGLPKDNSLESVLKAWVRDKVVIYDSTATPNNKANAPMVMAVDEDYLPKMQLRKRNPKDDTRPK